jgi:aminopeptidase N
LRDNLKKAQKHFREVKPMLDCFQEKFGEYPFWKDGYKLVEAPYLGMEHQSAIAYGNQYQKGYLGQDISNTGIGLLFDYITIHESGHEWFGNSITSADIADMWIHEAFATYCESVFIECQYGYDKSATYMSGKKRNILNRKPIIGQFGVNFKANNSDMYSKGALLLHTIRSVINNDQLWGDLLLDYSQTYKHTIIDTDTVVQFFNKKSNINLKPIFDQYLYHKNLPVLEVKIKHKKIYYRWQTEVTDFFMPIEIEFEEQIYRWEATKEWQSSDIKTTNLEEFYVVDKRFYINLEKIKDD